MNTLKAPQVYGEVILGNIDVQNDFCPGGTLDVKHGHKTTESTAPVQFFTKT